MIAAIVLLLLTRFGDVSIDPKVSADVDFQIDRHLQALLSDDDVDINFWYLVQMAASSDWIANAVSLRMQQIVDRSEDPSKNCLIEVLTKIGNISTANRIVESLKSGTGCRPYGDLAIAYIYELPLNERKGVQEKLIHTEDPIHREFLNKAVGNVYDQTILFSKRPARLADAYLLQQHHITSDSRHRDLINYWYQLIIDTPRLMDPIEFIMLQTVVTANHTIDRQFGDNYELLRKITNNRFYPTTTSKHVLYKRLVFTATAFGYFQTALNFYRNELLPLSSSIMPINEYLIVQFDFSAILYRIGDIKSALENYVQLYQSIDLIQDFRYKSSLLNNLAVSYLNSGYFDQYISLQLEAYGLATQINSPTYQLQILNNLYIYYKNNADWSSALLYLKEAEIIASKEGLISELTNIKISFATYYRDNEQDYETTIELLNDVIKVLEQENRFQELLIALGELAITYELMGDIIGIINTRVKINELAINRGDDRTEMESSVSIAVQYYRFGLIDEANLIMERYKSIDRELLEFRFRTQFTRALALHAYHNGDLNGAIVLLEDLMPAIISNIKFSGNIQTGSIYIEPAYKQVFTLLTDYLIEAREYVKAAIILDEYKNLNKASYLNSPLLKSSVLSEDELLRDIQISANIDQLRSQLIEANDDDRIQLNNQLSQFQDEQNRLYNKILSNNALATLDMRYVISRLGKNEIILAYTSIDSVMYITNINKKKVEVHRKRITTNEESRFEISVRQLHQSRPNLKSLYALGSEYVLPFIPDRTKFITVIPDAFIYQIPIEILPLADPASPSAYGSTTYLIEKYSVSYSNSVSDVITDRSSNSNSIGSIEFLGFGVTNFTHNSNNLYPTLSPLPFARDELEKANNTIGKIGNSIILMDSQANKANLFSLAPKSRIIHIASHSEVHGLDPLFSRIILSHSTESNSLESVYAYELFDLNLDTDLMILSSCESGSGTYRSGSGIIGLGRSLKFAGARSLILNSWSIRDKTAADMMETFYEYLANGHSKNDALRQSKIKYINEVNSNPAVWGSLILYGNSEPVVDTQDYWVIVLYLLMLLMLYLSGRYFYLRYFK